MRGRKTVLAVVVCALLLGACGDDDDSPTLAHPTPSASTGSTTAAVATGSATVLVSSVPSLGTVLVGPNGHTLYMFAKDKGTKSACTDGCAATWPALVASGSPVAGEGVDAAKLTVVSGQVAYNGHLLYSYSGDRAPGDANGATVPDWFALSPAGDKVVAAGDGGYQ